MWWTVYWASRATGVHLGYLKFGLYFLEIFFYIISWCEEIRLNYFKGKYIYCLKYLQPNLFKNLYKIVDRPTLGHLRLRAPNPATTLGGQVLIVKA